MKERPILFSKEMYEAIQRGDKTQTRRIITKKWVPDDWDEWSDEAKNAVLRGDRRKAPYQIGDRIWVREPFKVVEDVDWGPHCLMKFKYKHDLEEKIIELTSEEREKWDDWKEPYKGKSSLYMFKSLTRLWLEVKAVRVERLQDISHDDVESEGINLVEYAENYVDEAGVSLGLGTMDIYKIAFANLWDSINKNRADWQSNPWVLVIEFEKVGE